MPPAQAIISPNIVLTTLNAKFIHASLGLRYLLANMGELRSQTVLREFTIARQPQDIVDELLQVLREPAGQGIRIVGFGVYIWNVQQTTKVVRLLKAVRPDIVVVLGGPEVSHETDEQDIVALADHVITGWGELSFARLCRESLAGSVSSPRRIVGEQPPLEQIAFPYAEYSDSDLAHRLLYVEASRGCPFKCEFCLSSLDWSAWAFDLDAFLAQMHALYQRGARNFKFVDRTFNLKIDHSIRILLFFLERLGEGAESSLFLHFEVVPDHLPDRLKQVIALFPPGVLQFEVGIQSFNAEVQQRISRRQDNEKTDENMRWLADKSNAHLHADLIFGLPGETLTSFAAGFDRLYSLRPHEIQLGLLKRLRGTPIARHTAEFGMVYSAEPPYTVLQTGVVDSATVQRMTRFARYWDKIANSGRFKAGVAILLGETDGATISSPFQAFLDFSDWLWNSTRKTSELSPESLVDALFDYLVERGQPVETVRRALVDDYLASGARSTPRTLKGFLPRPALPATTSRSLVQRQERHLGTDSVLVKK